MGLKPVPDNALLEGARMSRQLFDAYLKAGFTEDQAIKLIAETNARMAAAAAPTT